MRKFFTSESVTEGHPDKICDQISDSVLDAILAEDPMARVACETACTTGLILVMGEITTTAKPDFQAIARETVRGIGYDHSDKGFDCNTCGVMTAIHGQSPDIAMGVDKALEAKSGEMKDDKDTGAGDQGMVFGFACNETPELMPMPISLAQHMAKRLSEVRKNGTLPYLRADGKTQVTVEYEDNKPVRVDAIVVSSQHAEEISLEQIREDIIREVIIPSVPAEYMDDNTKIYVNPTGRFVVGGPHGDSGLTGRKIIVDTYGGYASHGGGAFSGKDPTKVDRSAAYMARYVAKNIVAAGAADRCEVQIAYAIGVARPSPCLSTPTAPVRFPTKDSQKSSTRYSTFVPRQLSKPSTSASLSIRILPHTATSDVKSSALNGKSPTRQTKSELVSNYIADNKIPSRSFRFETVFPIYDRLCR